VKNMTPIERAALIEVRNGLVRGDYVHIDDDQIDNNERIFNMEVMASPCGTVACIGGWMATHMELVRHESILDYVKRGGFEGDLRKLFYPTVGGEMSRITTGQAVQAIDNFLMDGKPRWRKIVNG
jgi:hypothetical protein